MAGKPLTKKEETGNDLRATDRRIESCIRRLEPFGLRNTEVVLIFLPKERCVAVYDVQINKTVTQFDTWEQWCNAVTQSRRLYTLWMGPYFVYEFSTKAQSIIDERKLFELVHDQALPELGEQAGQVGAGE